MNPRTWTTSLLVILASFLTLQQSPDPAGDRLATILHSPALTSHDWQMLFSEADSGNAQAQYWLGRIYALGILLPKDSEKSAHWYERAAEQGYAPAEFAVCLMRANPKALNYEECIRLAAEKNVPEAQFLIGMAYDQHGWLGVTDKQEAFKWFKRSAEHDYVDAEAELGRCYKDGTGVEQSYALAIAWYRKAAEHVPDLGSAGQARNNLGLLHMGGLGVPKDSVQAYMWFSLADVETNLSVVRVDMTPAQILRAQQMADEWKKRHPDPVIY